MESNKQQREGYTIKRKHKKRKIWFVIIHGDVEWKVPSCRLAFRCVHLDNSKGTTSVVTHYGILLKERVTLKVVMRHAQANLIHTMPSPPQMEWRTEHHLNYFIQRHFEHEGFKYVALDSAEQELPTTSKPVSNCCTSSQPLMASFNPSKQLSNAFNPLPCNAFTPQLNGMLPGWSSILAKRSSAMDNGIIEPALFKPQFPEKQPCLMNNNSGHFTTYLPSFPGAILGNQGALFPSIQSPFQFPSFNAPMPSFLQQVSQQLIVNNYLLQLQTLMSLQSQPDQDIQQQPSTSISSPLTSSIPPLPSPCDAFNIFGNFPIKQEVGGPMSR